MLRKVECDNIFVLAKSEDRANTESHIIRSITESGASWVNRSSLPHQGRGAGSGWEGSQKSQKHREKAVATNLAA